MGELGAQEGLDHPKDLQKSVLKAYKEGREMPAPKIVMS